MTLALAVAAQLLGVSVAASQGYTLQAAALGLLYVAVDYLALTRG